MAERVCDKVVAAMSGGVDSSVAAVLLTQQGYDVTGMFMKNWEEDDRLGVCQAEVDVEDARTVCNHLGIPLLTRNFAAEYWEQVFEHFLAEYQAGRTPNPDILCNREIKFRTFLDHAEDVGGEMIATGHYARRDEVDGRFRLLRGLDHNKDQSYFLYTLGQEQLARTLFPVGELAKPVVREIAKQARLPVHDKKDSTGICFIGERNFKEFLSGYIACQPGPMVTPDGMTVGEHDGLMFYTLGQRQGLGLGGHADYGTDPWYVVDKDLDSNRLIVAQGHDHPLLFSASLIASEVSWVNGECLLRDHFRCSAKTRYRQADQDCEVQIQGENLLVTFAQPQRAVTPGQSVVFYRDQECLGGAVIDQRGSA